MNAIDSLEKRINALELQVLPTNRCCLSPDTQSVTDLLFQTQIMIKSALSCREAITSVLYHTLTLNEYLNPNCGSNEVDAKSKHHYLLELYPEIRESGQAVSTFEKLITFIDSEKIVKVTELAEKLENLTASNLTIYDKSREVTIKVLRSLQHYNDIITSIKLLFGSLDKAISELEEAFQDKFITEE